MLKKIIIGGIILAVVTVGVLFLIPWGEYESQVDKSEITNEVVYDESTPIVAPELESGAYYTTVPENASSAEILFHTKGLKDTKGGFNAFKIDFNVADDFTQSALDVVIESKSINTGNAMRDEHLLEEDFFHVEKFPTIEYHANTIAYGDTSYIAQGALTLNGTTKDLDVPFRYLGSASNEGINAEVFEGEFTFDRIAYGQEESSGVGNEVTINFYCELLKK